MCWFCNQPSNKCMCDAVPTETKTERCPWCTAQVVWGVTPGHYLASGMAFCENAKKPMCPDPLCFEKGYGHPGCTEGPLT